MSREGTTKEGNTKRGGVSNCKNLFSLRVNIEDANGVPEGEIRRWRFPGFKYCHLKKKKVGRKALVPPNRETKEGKKRAKGRRVGPERWVG